MTRQRMYLETMERLFSGTDKIILDTGGSGQAGGVVPFLPLNELTRRTPPAGRRPMKLGIVGGALVVLLIAAAILGYSSMFTVYQTQQALVVRLGQPVRGITRARPELQGAADRQRHHHRQAHPRSRSRRRRR